MMSEPTYSQQDFPQHIKDFFSCEKYAYPSLFRDHLIKLFLKQYMLLGNAFEEILAIPADEFKAAYSYQAYVRVYCTKKFTFSPDSEEHKNLKQEWKSFMEFFIPNPENRHFAEPSLEDLNYLHHRYGHKAYENISTTKKRRKILSDGSLTPTTSSVTTTTSTTLTSTSTSSIIPKHIENYFSNYSKNGNYLDDFKYRTKLVKLFLIAIILKRLTYEQIIGVSKVSSLCRYVKEYREKLKSFLTDCANDPKKQAELTTEWLNYLTYFLPKERKGTSFAPPAIKDLHEFEKRIDGKRKHSATHSVATTSNNNSNTEEIPSLHLTSPASSVESVSNNVHSLFYSPSSAEMIALSALSSLTSPQKNRNSLPSNLD